MSDFPSTSEISGVYAYETTSTVPPPTAPRTKCDNNDPLPNCTIYQTRGFDIDYARCECKPKCAQGMWWIPSQQRCGTQLQYDANKEEEARIEKLRLKCVKQKDMVYLYPDAIGGAGQCIPLEEYGGTGGSQGSDDLPIDFLKDLYECDEDGTNCMPTQTGWLAIGGAAVVILGAGLLMMRRR